LPSHRNSEYLRKQHFSPRKPERYRCSSIPVSPYGSLVKESLSIKPFRKNKCHGSLELFLEVFGLG